MAKRGIVDGPSQRLRGRPRAALCDEPRVRLDDVGIATGACEHRRQHGFDSRLLLGEKPTEIQAAGSIERKDAERPSNDSYRIPANEFDHEFGTAYTLIRKVRHSKARRLAQHAVERGSGHTVDQIVPGDEESSVRVAHGSMSAVAGSLNRLFVRHHRASVARLALPLVRKATTLGM